jgi:hypothetical protein
VTPLVWLTIPLVALIGALLWATWAGRERGPADPVDTVAAYHRFVQALERTRVEPPAGGPPGQASRRDTAEPEREAG